MSYQSKNGAWYETRGERALADSQYEQTQLLKKQNELIKQQQRDAERQRREQQMDAERQRREEIYREEQRRVEEENRRKAFIIAEADDIFRNTFCEHAQKAGIGDANAYYKKLLCLYNSLPNAEKLYIQYNENEKVNYYLPQKILQIITSKESLLSEYDENNEDKLMNYLSKAKEPLLSYEKKLTALTVYIAVSSILLFVSFLFDSPLLLLICAANVLISLIPYVIIITRSSVRKAITKSYNYLEIYNRRVKDTILENESRIKNYEYRRTVNFNKELELIFFSLNDAYDGVKEKLRKAGVDYIYPDFRLHYYDYPQGFIEEIKRYKREESIESELEIFNEL